MILAALCATVLGGLTPADFFPATPGTKRIYQERGASSSETIDTVRARQTIRGNEYIPVITTVNGIEVRTTYFRLDRDALFIVAYAPQRPNDPLELLKHPVPVFKLPTDNKEARWQYDVSLQKGMSDVHMEGTAKLGGKKSVLGKEVETLELKINATVGAGPTQEKVTQNAIYGRGVGLIENRTKSTIGRTSVESVVKLVRIELPGESP